MIADWQFKLSAKFSLFELIFVKLYRLESKFCGPSKETGGKQNYFIVGMVLSLKLFTFALFHAHKTNFLFV